MLLLTEVERGEEYREAEHHGGDVLLAAAAHRPALGQDLVEHHVEDGARGHPWVQGQCCSVQILCCPTLEYLHGQVPPRPHLAAGGGLAKEDAGQGAEGRGQAEQGQGHAVAPARQLRHVTLHCQN